MGLFSVTFQKRDPNMIFEWKPHDRIYEGILCFCDPMQNLIAWIIKLAKRKDTKIDSESFHRPVTILYHS